MHILINKINGSFDYVNIWCGRKSLSKEMVPSLTIIHMPCKFWNAISFYILYLHFTKSLAFGQHAF